MKMFIGDDMVRKAAYLNNILANYKIYQEGLVPFEWAGYVFWKSCEEFKTYFPDEPPLETRVPEGVLGHLKTYTPNEEDGQLFSVLQKKFEGMKKR